MKKNKVSIGQQLRDFAANIVVDPFGYEQIIHQNARNFAIAYSEGLSLPSDQIRLKIVSKRSLLQVYLYAADKVVKQVDLAELVSFFTGLKSNIQLE